MMDRELEMVMDSDSGIESECCGARVMAGRCVDCKEAV